MTRYCANIYTTQLLGSPRCRTQHLGRVVRVGCARAERERHVGSRKGGKDEIFLKTVCAIVVGEPVVQDHTISTVRNTYHH